MKKILFQFGNGLGPLSIVYPYLISLSNEECMIKYIGPSYLDDYIPKNVANRLDNSFNEDDIPIGDFYSNWLTAEEFWEKVGYCYSDINWLWSKVKQLRNILLKYQPDYIITSLGMLSGIMSRILNVPMIGIVQSCYHPECIFPRVRWWENRSNRSDLSLLRNINDILSYYNVSKINKFEEIFTGDITVVPGVPELDPLNDNNHYNTIYSGLYIGYENYTNIELKKNNTAINDNSVFCYTGKFHDNVGNSGLNIFKLICSIAKKHGNMDFTVTTGNKADVEEANKILFSLKQKNIKVFESLDENWIYQNYNLIIHHGGHGCCMSQIKYCKPAIILPTHSEREYNARNMVSNNCSLMICENDWNAENLYHAIVQIKMKYNSMKERLKTIHDNSNKFGIKKVIKKILD